MRQLSAHEPINLSDLLESLVSYRNCCLNMWEPFKEILFNLSWKKAFTIDLLLIYRLRVLKEALQSLKNKFPVAVGWL